MSRARPTFATAIALMLLALSPPGAARAGSYEVYSCHPDGIAHGWVPSHTAGATAYIECGSSATAAGLRARNVINGLMAPVFTNGQVAITSPPGTYFDWMRFDADLRAQIGWRAGIHDLVRRTWIWCGTSACTSSFGWRSIETPVAATRSLAVMTICSKLQCGPNTEPWGFLGIRNVRLRVQDPVKPSLRLTGGSLLSGGWLRKSASIQARADDNSGIREITIAIGNGLRLRHEPSCDFHRTAPCPASQSVANVFSLVTDADGSHRLRVRAVDAAGNATETTRTVRIDNTPPDRVTELGAQPASWSSSSRFDVSWTNPSSGAGSPVAAARYELCSDVCSAVRTVGGIGLERTQVSVPRPGKWRLRLWLVDSAGNEDRSAAQEIELLHDPTPPTLKFAPSELDNPGSLRIDVRDELSGVATTELELQREGDDIWLALPLTPTATGVVSFVDDEALPAGKYIVRARATDRAGNEDTVQGSSLELPFRLATKLTVGQQRRVRAQNLGPHRHRRVIVKNPRAAFGRKVRLTGRLTSPGRNPLASRDIDISELRADSAGYGVR